MESTSRPNMSNATTAAPPTKDPYYDDWDDFLWVFYIVVMIVTILGNSLVCITIYADRRLRSPTNWFIASLAVSDLSYALSVLPFRIVSTVLKIQERWVCQVWIWMDMCCVAASLANLAVISVDRHLKITKPFDYHRKMTKWRSFVAIGGVWLYAATLSTLSIIAWPGAPGVVLSPRGLCSNSNKTFYTVAIIVAFLCPLIVLVVCYTMILRTAWIQFSKMQLLEGAYKSSKEDKRKQKSVRRDFKATKTLAIVMMTFTVCWMPFFIVFTIRQYDPFFLRSISDPKLQMFIFNMITFVLPNLNSTLNPFIYAYFNIEYRRAFKKLIVSVCDKEARRYISAKRRSSLTSFFQSPFARRATPPSDDGNHNQNHMLKDDAKCLCNGDTMVTQI